MKKYISMIVIVLCAFTINLKAQSVASANTEVKSSTEQSSNQNHSVIAAPDFINSTAAPVSGMDVKHPSSCGNCMAVCNGNDPRCLNACKKGDGKSCSKNSSACDSKNCGAKK